MRVAFLTNTVPAYRASTLACLAARIPGMCVLLTGSPVQNRAEPRCVDGARQILLKSLVFRNLTNHPDGITRQYDLHIPYDLLFEIAKLRPAVILASELGARTLQAMIYRLLLRSSRIIILADLSEDTERSVGLSRATLRRFLLAHADLVVVNGRSGERYVRALGAQADRIMVIPYATDNLFLDAAPRPDSHRPPRALLHVGQLIERKGLHHIIAGLARWCERHPSDQVQLTLIGDGPLRTSLTNFSRPLNLTVLVKGAVPYNTLPDHYRNADLFVFPTLADTWGLVVNEAMAMGVPVLGSIMSQAVTELIENGRCGWWFNPTSQYDVDLALDHVLQLSGDTFAEIARRARSRAAQFTPEHVAAQFETAIRRVLLDEA